MNKWLLLLLILCGASLCVAQGVRYDLPPVIGPRGLPIPNIQVSLCPGTAVISGSTCGTTAQAFTDQGLNTPCTSGLPVTPPNLQAPQGVGVCSATGDSLGNVGFWLSPGSYIYCLNGPSITGKCYNLTVPAGATSGGGLTAAIMNVVAHVGGNVSSADIGTQINTAYTNCPAAPSSCKIIIDPNPTGAEYNFSTPIVLATADKYASLECAAPADTQTGGTGSHGGLNYTPTTATVMLTMDFGSNTAANSTPVLRGCHFTNNQCFTTGGCGSSATGLKVGNTNQGMNGGSIVDTTFQGFGTALDDTNPNTVASFVMRNVFFQQNATAWLEGTHDIVASGTQFAGNGTGIRVNGANDAPELYLTDLIFANQTGLDIDTTNVTGSFPVIHAKGLHLERAPGRLSHSISGRMFMDFVGGMIEDDNATTDWLITLNNSVIALDWTRIIINNPSTSFIVANANVRGVVNVLTSNANLNTKAQIVSGASAGQFSTQVVVNGATATPVPWLYESPIVVGGGSGQLGLGEITVNFSSATNNAISFNDTATNGILSTFGPAAAGVSNTLLQWIWSANNSRWQTNLNGLQAMPSTGVYGLTNSATTAASGTDTGWSRDAAGVWDAGNGTAADTTAKVQAAGYISKGTKFTSNGGCTESTLVGGATAGSFKVGQNTACTIIITMGNTATAPNGWTCTAYDNTAVPAIAIRQTAQSATSCSLLMTVATNDVIVFSAIGW